MTAVNRPTDDCINCGRPFPATAELAALPNAKRIAVDPELGRVWRICTGCSHWNLVGPESRDACIDELRARLPLSDRPTIGFDSLGRVDVLVVSTREDTLAASKHGLKARQVLKRGRLLRPLVVLAPFVGMFLSLFFEPGAILSLEFWQTLGIAAVGVTLGEQLKNRISRRAVSVPVVGTAALGAIMLVFVVPQYSRATHQTSAVTFFLIASTMIVLAGLQLIGPTTSVRATDGKRLRLTKLALRDMVLSHDMPSGAIAASGFPHGRAVIGSDVGFVIGHLAEQDHGKATAEEVEAGWLLLRRSGTVPDLVRALDRARPEAAGRHSWAELPMAWRVAFYLGAVEAYGSEDERESLRQRIRDASEVASLADGLENESREG